MEADSPFRRTLAGLGILLVGGLLISLALPAPSPRNYPERIPVEFWHMWTAEWKVVVEEIVAEFNESQDRYEVIPLSIPSSGGADTKFVLSVTGGDPPDIMTQWNPVIPNWANAGLLQPLEEFMTAAEWEELRESMYPIARKIGIYDGHLYGVTTGLNLWAAYYHPEHFREAGLDPDEFPETLEELMEVSRQLEKFDGRNLTRVGFLLPWFSFTAALFGGGFYDWDREEVILNTPQNLRALRYMVAERQRLGYDNVVRFRAGIDENDHAGGWPFIGEHYSIIADGQWRVEQIARYAPNLDYRTAPIPPPEGGPMHAGNASGNFMIIPRGAANPEGAWEFLKFWSGIENPERAARFYVKAGWLPLTPAIAEAPAYQAYLEQYPEFQTFVDLLDSEHLQTTAPVAYNIYLFDRVGQAGDLAMRRLITPEEALLRLEREIRDEQDRRRMLGYGR